MPLPSSGQGRETAAHLDSLADQWHDEARRCEEERRQLNYQAPNERAERGTACSTRTASRAVGLWATLNSMRNVEGTGSLKSP